MSSPIHSARCVAREGASVEIELAPTTACGAHFPLSPFFGLALLHECATTIVYSKPGQVASFGRNNTPLGLAVRVRRRGDDVAGRALIVRGGDEINHLDLR